MLNAEGGAARDADYINHDKGKSKSGLGKTKPLRIILIVPEK